MDSQQAPKSFPLLTDASQKECWWYLIREQEWTSNSWSQGVLPHYRWITRSVLCFSSPVILLEAQNMDCNCEEILLTSSDPCLQCDLMVKGVCCLHCQTESCTLSEPCDGKVAAFASSVCQWLKRSLKSGWISENACHPFSESQTS